VKRNHLNKLDFSLEWAIFFNIMHWKNLLNLIRHLKLVHHIKGRIRFQIEQQALETVAQINIDEIVNLIRSLPSIEDVRINPIAASIIIYYNPEQIQPKLWEQLSNNNESELPQIFDILKPQFQT
jgi:hypothetical protein